MMEKIPVEIIEDLLPLYRDDVLSGEVKELVESRLQGSEELRTRLALLEKENAAELEESGKRESRFLGRIKRSRHYIIGVIIGAMIPIGALVAFILYVIVMNSLQG